MPEHLRRLCRPQVLSRHGVISMGMGIAALEGIHNRQCQQPAYGIVLYRGDQFFDQFQAQAGPRGMSMASASRLTASWPAGM